MRLITILFVAVAGLVGWGVVIGGKAYAEDVGLRDKIGQMLIVGFDGKEITSQSSIVQDIQHYNIGGVILFDYNFKTKTFDKNIESLAQVTTLNMALKQANNDAQLDHRRASLPLLISVDYEGGQVNRLKESYGFPKTYRASDVGQMSILSAEKIAQTMATTLYNTGFNLNFAPVLDVNVNPANPILGQLGRVFSDDPQIVAQYAGIYTKQFLNYNVQCAYKHFPGHGSSTSDSHLGFVDVSETWKSYELNPYQNLINQNQTCGMIMTAHIVNRQLDNSGLPATLSHKVLTELLRQELQFEGVIVSDDMQMKAISEHYGLEEALTLSINAGVDMFIFGNQLVDKPQDIKVVIDIIEAKVKSGEISQDRIEDAYRRIVALKRSI